MFLKKNTKGHVTKYETYQPQSNPRDPRPWESVKRYDGPGGDPHWNKVLKQDVGTPPIHDPSCPGGVRPPLSWETPK